MLLRDKSHRRVRCVVGILTILFAWAGTSRAVNPPKPFARAPYLQSASPRSIHVVWRTEGQIEPLVRFGEDPARLGERTKLSDIVIRASLGTNGQELPPQWAGLRTRANLALPKLHSAPVGTFQYEARLKDLRPETTYYYAVYDGDRRLTPEDASYRFTTHPLPGSVRPVRFWVIGDGGTGREAQAAVHEAMLRTVERENHPLDFWIHVGDMAYGVGRDMEFQSRFFESYEVTLRNKVCWPTMGNHEGYTSNGRTGIGPYYDAYVVPSRGEVGGLASGTEAYYSFDYANIHFVCLDSHDLDRRPGEPMGRWLAADLEKARADWVIAFWHHPPYTKGSHDSDKEKDLTEMRQLVMPVIEQGGVDLVLTGHSHVYERSMLMDGAYGTNTVAENFVLDDGDGSPTGDGAYRKSEGIHPHQGTVQIVTGNAGAQLGRNGTMPVMRTMFVEHGSTLIDIEGDTLVARMINREGVQRDLFSMVKRGRVTHNRLALPWQLGPYVKPTNEVTRAGAEDKLVDFRVLIPHGDTWRYLYDPLPPGLDWSQPEFDDSRWPTGPGGFGFGPGTHGTDLSAMRGGHTILYLRHAFEVEQADRVTELGLRIDYDDAFIAYLNGHEVARVGVGRSSGRNAQKLVSRKGGGSQYIALKDAHRYLRNGTNVLAIEGHNGDLASIDFRLDPVLILED